MRLSALVPSKTITQYIIEYWKTDRGLPQNSILSMRQSREGFIWVGTMNGLARFDGGSFKVYNENTAPGFRGSLVNDIAEDSQGRLWLVTDRGLGMMANGNFHFFGAADGLPEREVLAVCVAADDAVWIGTERGVFRRVNQRFVQHPCPIRRPVEQVFLDRQGGVLAFSGNRLWRLRGDTCIPLGGQNLPPEQNNTLYSFHCSRSGTIWALSTQQLFRIYPDRMETVAFPEKFPNLLHCVYEDSNGDLWLGLEGDGVARLRNGTLEYLSTGDGLPSAFISTIMEDHEGNIWAGTHDGGLVCLRDSVCTTFTQREGLVNNMAWCIYRDTRGGLWCGGNLGVSRLVGNRFVPAMSDMPWTGRRVYGILEDRHGNFWLGTDMGLIRRGTDGRYRRFDERDGLPAESIYVIHETRKGTLWVGTASGLFEIRGNRAEPVANARVFLRKPIVCLRETENGTVWIGSRDGLYVMSETEPPRQVCEGNVYCIYVDREERVWVGGARMGIQLVQRNRLYSIIEASPISGETIHGFCEDGRGNLWASSPMGVFRLPMAELEALADGRRPKISWRLFTEEDGMRSRFCNGSNQGGLMTPDGKIWFPTIKGLVCFDPRGEVNHALAPVVIDGVTVNNTFHPRGGRLFFPAGTERFEFHFTLPFFSLQAKVRFRYRLQGFDQEWIVAGAEPKAIYTNLGPGKYEFLVNAGIQGGEWSKDVVRLAFTNRGYIYQKQWFIALCLCLFAFASYWFIHWLRGYLRVVAFWRRQNYIGHYRLCGELGSGGMATVYRAVDLLDKNREVALKVLRDDMTEMETQQKRLRQEAAIIDHLDHPNVVRIIERGQDNTTMYIAMELLEGITLAKRIADGAPLPVVDAVAIMLQIVDALERIHIKEIVHRDLKPENILLVKRGNNSDFVKLLDFGLALSHSQTRLTQAGIIVGTLAYLPPERLGQGLSTFAGDIYSAGVIFYEMVTGEKLFDGEHTFDIVHRILNETPAPPVKKRPDLPPDINALIMTMIDADPERRITASDARLRLVNFTRTLYRQRPVKPRL